MLGTMLWVFINQDRRGEAMDTALRSAKRHVRAGPFAKLRPTRAIFSFRVNTARILQKDSNEVRILDELRTKGIVDIKWWEEDTWEREVVEAPNAICYTYTSKWAAYTLAVDSRNRIKLKVKVLLQKASLS